MSDSNYLGNEFPDLFVMCSETLMQKTNPTIAAVFGKIWLLARKLGYSKMSHGHIAQQMGLNIDTVKDALDVLMGEEIIRGKKNKYYDIINKKTRLLIDVTPERFKSKRQVRWYAPLRLNFDDFIKKWQIVYEDKYEINEEEEKVIYQQIEAIENQENISKNQENLVDNSEKIVDDQEKILDQQEKILDSQGNLSELLENSSESPENVPTKRLLEETKKETNKKTKQNTTEQTKEKTNEGTTGYAGNESTKTIKQWREEIKAEIDRFTEEEKREALILAKQQNINTRYDLVDDTKELSKIFTFIRMFAYSLVV
jgi:outer membrane biosynthesis protein TonB